MLVRSVLFACAAMMASAVAPAMAETPDSGGCQATTFRVYFPHGSAAMDQTAMETLAVAERMVASCGYAELHVAVDASSTYAAERGAAIQAAADGRSWDVVRVEPRSAMHRASYAAPEYAEVTMTPEAMPIGAPMTERGAGV